MQPEAPIAQQAPVWRFALFFKTYGIALGMIVAATPIISQAFNLLPSYASNRGILTFTTSLVSFLCVAFLFGVRRNIGEAVFPRRRALPNLLLLWRQFMSVSVPGLLAVLSLLMLFLYLQLLQISLSETALRFSYVGQDPATPLRDVLAGQDSAEGYLFGLRDDRYKIVGWAYPERTFGWPDTAQTQPQQRVYEAYLANESVELILSTTPAAFIYHGLPIAFVYTLIFLFSVAAFTWLGIVDYIRDELGLADRQLLTNPYRRIRNLEFKVPDIVDRGASGGKTYSVYFALEYDPEETEEGYLEYTGPYCGEHNRLLTYDGRAGGGGHSWLCGYQAKGQHSIILDHDRHEMRALVRATALREMYDDRVRRGAPTVITSGAAR